jgi:hypothetical protein
MQVPDAVAMKLGQEAQREYRQELFGEDAVHVGVAGVPFLDDQDKEPGGFNMPVRAGIYMKEGNRWRTRSRRWKRAARFSSAFPTDSLRPRDRLVAALQRDRHRAGGAGLMDEYQDPKALASLAMSLAERGTSAAIQVSNRIRAGEFDGES